MDPLYYLYVAVHDTLDFPNFQSGMCPAVEFMKNLVAFGLVVHKKILVHLA